MNALRAGVLMFAKDLRIEGRSRRSIGVATVLGVMVVAVLTLGLSTQSGGGGASAASILWIAYLFGAMLCFDRSMSIEREYDALAGLMMAPIDAGVIYLAKTASNFAITLLFAALVTPVAVLFCGIDLSIAPWTFVQTMLLGLVGICAVGTLFSAALTSSRTLAVIIFPLCLPLIIVSSKVIADAFTSGAPTWRGGQAILVAFDAVFIAASWLMFEHVLEPEGG